MKIKKYKEKYSKKAKKKPVINKKYVDINWVLIITFLAFIISLFFSYITEFFMPNANVLIALLIILLFIILGIIFDMVGISITVADIKTFNSMATKRVRGATIGVNLIKNSEKASSFCNDVIGDICGIISGSAGISLVSILSNDYNINVFVSTLIITALISSLTIGGKALGKSLAINKSTYILYNFSRFLSLIYNPK